MVSFELIVVAVVVVVVDKAVDVVLMWCICYLIESFWHLPWSWE